jgi:hypothetical protein
MKIEAIVGSVVDNKLIAIDSIEATESIETELIEATDVKSIHNEAINVKAKAPMILIAIMPMVYSFCTFLNFIIHAYTFYWF